MKPIRFYLLFIVFSLGISFCRKDNIMPAEGTSLVIVNTIVGSNALRTNFSDIDEGKFQDTFKWWRNALSIAYGSYQEVSAYNDATSLSLISYPDSTNIIFRGTFNLPKNTMHCLFMTGTLAAPDSMFISDNPPYHPAIDSSFGLRFINLSPGSNPISVNIKGQTNGSEINGLAFKGITSFKNYPATASVSTYIFEIRDGNSGTLLSTFTISGVNNGSGTNTSTNNYRYRNFTLALKGLPGGSGNTAQGAFLINNY